MQSDEVRRGYTARAFCMLSPWNEASFSHSVLQLHLGSNFISSLEVVSSLNTFNLAYGTYYYGYDNRAEKYNPKVYLSTIHTTAKVALGDVQINQKNGLPNLLPGSEKSGSLKPQKTCKNVI